MLVIVIAVAACLLILVVYAISLYNKMVKDRLMVKEGWSGIATFLQQRSDLIPNLVETVKGYALHESSTLTEVVKWRNRSLAAQGANEQMEASAGLHKSLMDFFVLSEQYPDLKANTNFLSLQNDLKDIEGKLNQSRRYYNGTVRNFNQVISIFPNNLVAGAFNFSPEPFFQEETGAAASPSVKFT